MSDVALRIIGGNLQDYKNATRADAPLHKLWAQGAIAALYLTDQITPDQYKEACADIDAEYARRRAVGG